MTTIIKLTNVTKKFGDFTAVDNVSLEIKQGEVFGLLGTNGAGKTTLIRLMTGLINATEGEITIFDKDVKEELMAIRRQLALLPQESSPYEELTAFENIYYYGQMHDTMTDEELKTRTKDLIKLIGLEGRENDQTKEYSGGMKRKVLVARAMVTNPDLLFLDEPSAAIDILGARTVRNLIKKLARDEKKTILITTHDLNEVDELCDRVGIMVAGKLVAVGTPDDLEKQFEVNHIEHVFTALSTGEGIENLEGSA
ncbi:MAG: ABC transporter ATP-binding protein [Candidatus Kariarchaeaceae archaeon]|jgi:ABC-2 type transport system ATP-binding protein